MNKQIHFVSAAALVLGLVAAIAVPAMAGGSPGTLEFKASNKMYSAHGKFEHWHFTKIDIPDGDITKGTVEFEVELASVSEKTAKLADHLRTSDFFDVEKFGKATIKIHGAKSNGDGMYEATATIALHGQTHDMPVAFKITGKDPLKIEGTAKLDRVAFGIGGPYDAENDRSITQDVEILIDATLDH